LLTKAEAKAKCIAMWEYIAEHINDKAWRNAAKSAGYFDEDGERARGPDRYKWHAIRVLYPKDYPSRGCYLCQHIREDRDLGCDGCPLGVFGRDMGCEVEGEPFPSWCTYTSNYDYKEAARVARRLANKVRAWEVDQ
jgi:hypothetical protein